MQFDENGLFVGLSKDEKANAVLAHLSPDKDISLQGLIDATGLTASQIHVGIRHLREARPHCVITYRRGPISAYRLAEDAPEVSAYALRRMRHWRTQVSIIAAEMEMAKGLFPSGWVKHVERTADSVSALLKVFIGFEEAEIELQKKQERFEREVARNKSTTSRQPKQPASV